MKPIFQSEEFVAACKELQDYIETDVTQLAPKKYYLGPRSHPVYVGHFKCNKQRIADYPNIWGYLRELYQVDGVAGTVNMEHIKRHYNASHTMINPTGVVPLGPEIDFMEPHGRDRTTGRPI